jgi:hypothetical protein
MDEQHDVDVDIEDRNDMISDQQVTPLTQQTNSNLKTQNGLSDLKKIEILRKSKSIAIIGVVEAIVFGILFSATMIFYIDIFLPVIICGSIYFVSQLLMIIAIANYRLEIRKLYNAYDTITKKHTHAFGSITIAYAILIIMSTLLPVITNNSRLGDMTIAINVSIYIFSVVGSCGITCIDSAYMLVTIPELRKSLEPESQQLL